VTCLLMLQEQTSATLPVSFLKGGQREVASYTAHCIDTAQPPESQPTKTETHGHLYHQCRSKSVSAKSLPKTGISGKLAGDFRQFLAKVAAIRSLETEREKSHILQAFCDYCTIYLRLTNWLVGEAVLIAPVSTRIPC
jgi:hypothetical protein